MGTATPDRTPERRVGLTGRAIAVVGLIVFLTLILAGPAHRYLAAHNALNQAAQQRADDERRLAQLETKAKNLQDPAYIERLARNRLQYAMPGDTVYVVTNPGDASQLADDPVPTPSLVRQPGQTWNERLWGTVKAADGAGK